MASFTNIVINDGASPSVAHTFAVKSNDNRVSRYEDRAGGIPLGFGKLAVKISDINKNNRRVEFTIETPVLEAVSGANPSGFVPAASVAYYNKVTIGFVTNNRSTTRDRKDLLAYVKNLMALPLVSSIVVDGEEISG